MNFLEYLKIIFLERCFQLQGRASRREACYGFLVLFVVINLVEAGILAYFTLVNNDFYSFLAAFIAVNLVMSIPGITLIVRRLHDSNRSGFNYFIVFVPFLNIYLLYLIFLEPGTEGPNKYGPVEVYKSRVDL